MGKMAFVFAGVGHSYSGMGRDLYETFPVVRSVFEEVSDLTGVDIAHLCFEGPEGLLRRYVEGTFAQLAMGIACYRIVSDRGIRPDFFCGPCIGQVTSWVATEALDMGSVIQIIRRLEELIQGISPGLLARIVGLELEVVQDICHKAGQQGVIDVAVIMGPGGGICVSGQPRPVKMALELARRAGAREAAPVDVELRPVHSRLVEPVSRQLLSSMSDLAFRDPKVPIVSSLDGQPKCKAGELLPNFAHELYSTSDWQMAVNWLLDHSVDTFLSLALAREIVRAIDNRITSLHVRDVQTLNSTMAFLWDHNML
jgi:[acyl-carrier-protein] S-malonyltransferase